MGSRLTDFIPAETLRREGYIYKGDTDEMIEAIGAERLNSRGWFNVERLRGIMISVNRAAHIIGIHPSTLSCYVSAGALAVNSEGKVSMFDALLFDYQDAKRKHLASKTNIKNK